MIYQGGKFRQASQIVPIINKCIKDCKITEYYEPFVGGASILTKIQCKSLNANDIDEELIAFYEHLKSGGEMLPDVSRDLYYQIKADTNAEPWIRGSVKYMASFGGKPWGGYGGIDKRVNHTKYYGAKTNVMKQIPVFKIANFAAKDYRDYEISNGAFVYCDPPYKNTTEYKNKFDSDEFYEWFRELSQRCYCILSEHTAPQDFTCFKEMSIRKTMPSDNNKSYVVDKLFYCEGLFKDYYIKENV